MKTKSKLTYLFNKHNNMYVNNYWNLFRWYFYIRLFK